MNLPCCNYILLEVVPIHQGLKISFSLQEVLAYIRILFHSLCECFNTPVVLLFSEMLPRGMGYSLLETGKVKAKTKPRGKNDALIIKGF